MPHRPTRRRPRGHIRQRGENSWSVVITMPPDPATGKRRQKWHTVHGERRDAERELTRLLAELDVGTYVQPARMSLAEYLRKWLEDYARHNTRPKSYELYRYLSERHIIPALGSTPLPELRPPAIQSFYAAKLTEGRLSPQTVRHCHTVIRESLGHAVK